MRGPLAVVVVAALAFGLAGVGYAGEAGGLAGENAQLRQRVDKLEGEVGELKKMVKDLIGRPPRGVPELTAEEVAHLKTISTSLKGVQAPVSSGVNAQIYGYVKADASWDSSNISTGNFARWVASETNNKNDDQYTMTASQTRLGIKLFGPDQGGIRTTGLIEGDFYVTGAPENKAEFFMRHAYVNLEWPEHRFSFLAGQTWDTMSPLNPPVLNYPVSWWAGNYGYRRPQMRATKTWGVGKDVDLKVAAAIARSMGRDGGFGAGDSGEDSGLPVLQGRAGLTFPLIGAGRTDVGISGHWGHEEYDTDIFGTNERYESWSVCFDATQPVNEWLAFKGELYTGQNLDQYLGGIGQGVDLALDKEVGACGGWAAASFGPFDKWRFNLGTSMERIARGDVSAAAARTFNQTVFGNALYSVNKNVTAGLEISQWRTEYRDTDRGDSVRFQASVKYAF